MKLGLARFLPFEKVPVPFQSQEMALGAAEKVAYSIFAALVAVFDDLQQTFDPFPHDLLSVGGQGEMGTGSFSAFRKGARPIFYAGTGTGHGLRRLTIGRESVPFLFFFAQRRSTQLYSWKKVVIPFLFSQVNKNGTILFRALTKKGRKQDTADVARPGPLRCSCCCARNTHLRQLGVLGTLFNCSPILNDPHPCGRFSYRSLCSIRSDAGELGTGSFSAVRKGACPIFYAGTGTGHGLRRFGRSVPLSICGGRDLLF